MLYILDVFYLQFTITDINNQRAEQDSISCKPYITERYTDELILQIRRQNFIP